MNCLLNLCNEWEEVFTLRKEKLKEWGFVLLGSLETLNGISSIA